MLDPSDRPTRPAEPAEKRHGGLVTGQLAWARALISRNIRDNDVAIVVLGILVGVGVGLSVIVLQQAVFLLHAVFFGLPFGAHLSEGVGLGPWRPLVTPVLGGLVLGTISVVGRRIVKKPIVDPIEANALYGGRMSMIDSMRLAASTLLSNGFGASVGMEAAYTQFGSGIGSVAGRAFKLRRADLRILVGCGSAAAIAAAFNAPIAGAFYAFELVIGSYTLASFAPVSLAALCGGLITRAVGGNDPIFGVTGPIAVAQSDYFLFALIGVGAAVLGIATMTSVTLTERLFRRLPRALRPVLGGGLVGGIAVALPQVLGSGHGAVQLTLDHAYTGPLLIALLAGKAIASAISIGSGFRGGLFSSALFLGALYGGACALLIGAPPVGHAQTSYMLVGMGAVAASIVGAPVTMVMLVQEATGDFPITVGVLTGVVVATLIVRHGFGYSFATWRFHTRGVAIHGAHDVGWIETLTVERLMRRDPKTVSASMPLSELRRAYPPGSAKQLFILDPAGGYLGVANLAEIHGLEMAYPEDAEARDFALHAQVYLLPGQNVRNALKAFVASETEALAVVSDSHHRRVIGYLTEAYALRRYTEELERRRREELGDRHLFG